MHIVSFMAPRRDHPFYQDYSPFLNILRASCEKFGHRHIVITDDASVGRDDDAFVTPLPDNLMRAILAGQLAYLQSALAKEDTVLLGADCALARDPAEVFKQEFDIAFTTGPFTDCILNTGAIYIRGGSGVAYIWERALGSMRLDAEWGDDQKALAAVVHPTLEPSVTVGNGGPIIRFLPVDPFNLAPEYPGDDCTRGTVLHFRGPRKDWMMDYCADWLGIGSRVEWDIRPNSPQEQVFANVRVNSQRNVSWVVEVPEHDGHAVLVGGGPSAADDIDEIWHRYYQHQTIFALNGAAGWLKKEGIEADYQVILDARPENCRFVSSLDASAFLVASQCDPSVFETLSGQSVILFHHWEEGIADCFDHKPSVLIGGGITVGLTAIALVYAMGYRQIHLYGYDSSDRENASHAYEQAQKGAEAERREVWVGRKKFVCAPGMFAQAKAFPAFAALMAEHGAMITVHGSGLLPEMAKQAFGPFWAAEKAA
jgi:uncharacterized Rossmann fold enzyme